MKLAYILISLVAFTVAYSVAQPSAEKFTHRLNGSVSQFTDTVYAYKTIMAHGKTWGYDIYKGSKCIIHQLTIPGIPGNEGFKSQSDAEKVAKLVITKLKNGEMPPSVSKEELVNLKVLK